MARPGADGRSSWSSVPVALLSSAAALRPLAAHVPALGCARAARAERVTDGGEREHRGDGRPRPAEFVREPAWWRGAVVHQIYPRSFQDSDGDGVGDLPGVVARLDHLNDGTERSLGVDAIWLSPFYPSPMADFGYDVADYTGVDPLFGTLARRRAADRRGPRARASR